jgi:hypothetical protein
MILRIFICDILIVIAGAFFLSISIQASTLIAPIAFTGDPRFSHGMSS